MNTHAATPIHALPGLDELETAELVVLVRQGNQGAYATLYDRYSYAAHRLARHLGMRDEADDIVSESFARILDLMRRGKGPADNFRSYLFTTIRHQSGARAKARQKLMPTDDDSTIDTAVPFGDNQLDGFERETVRAAYESLPERWQTVLWQLEVEGHKPQQIAEALNISPNTVSALAYRARSGLRHAYLQQHVTPVTDGKNKSCADFRLRLPALVQQTASPRDFAKAGLHLQSCPGCQAAYQDLCTIGEEIGITAAPLHELINTCTS